MDRFSNFSPFKKKTETVETNTSYVTFHYLDEVGNQQEAYKKFEPQGSYSLSQKKVVTTSGGTFASNFIEDGFIRGHFTLADWNDNNVQITIPSNRILKIVRRQETSNIEVEVL